MALHDGSRLGPYEIVARLGAGGMGEVYRARDPRLGRDVAIKVLPDTFAADPERLARFEREARLLASLQHANIALLHGLEEADGRRYLVMQCVEGESLAQRLSRGALPQADALEIAGAIAAGLEAAHESGVVHRDLKPGNVMVTPAGEVKVLDFGLAKGGAGTSSSDTGLSASPTMSYAATHAGVILGTAAYMSPEQARGKPVDRRTDIWSFGCVLYELLTGKQAFAGETISDIVARILQTEPDWTALPEGTSGRVRDLMVRCLQKDARRRLRDIGDARVEIEDILSGRVSASGAHEAPAATLALRQRWLVPAGIALVLLTAIATWFASRALAPAPPRVATRFVVESPRGQTLPGDAMTQSLSPDGTQLALISTDSSGVARVWIRRMDALTAKVLPGTQGVTTMFWSPDSRYIAFFAGDRQLSKVAIAGGDPEPICDVKVSRGGTWNKDGVILLAPFSNGAIYRVSANGGDLTAVVRPDSAHGENGLRFPSFLPDGKHFLYSSLPIDSSGKLRVCLGSLDGSAPRVLLRAESGATYAEPGWLLFTRRGVLAAQRFNARRLELAGDPVSLGDAASGAQYTGACNATVSRNGVLAFATLDAIPSRLAWMDFHGHELGGIPGVLGNYFRAALSPDEHHAILGGIDASLVSFLAVVDLDRGVVSRATPEGAQSSEFSWSLDGRAIAHVDDSRRATIVVRSLVDGTQRDYVTNDPAFKRIDGWTPDGRSIIYERLDSGTKWDIWLLPLDGDSPPRPLLHSAANEERSSLSRDGRWLAYQSDESGTNEVYVVPFGTPGARYQLTNGGGMYPLWRRDGAGLFLLDPRRPTAIMQSDLHPGAEFSMGAPREVGRVPDDIYLADFARDGKRLLVLRPAEKPRPQTITLVQNWTAALRKP